MLSRKAIRVVIAVPAAIASLALTGPATASDAARAHAARSPHAVAAASPQCSGASTRGGGAQQEHAILCLINAERDRVGAPRLRLSRALSRAAGRHARDMTRRDFFDHTSPGGETPTTRAKRAGYNPATISENIAFGTGSWGTPAGTIAQWLDSPPHRRAMLSRGVRDLGVGAVSGSPLDGVSGGVTVAADFGRR